MSTVKGKKVLVRKPQAGDTVISRLTGREYTVSQAVKTGRSITHVVAKSNGWKGLEKGFRVSDVAVLSKKA